MNLAVFSREHSWVATNTIEYFCAQGCPISLVVIETSIREKRSATQLAFAAAHAEYDEVMTKRAQQSRPKPGRVRLLWSRMPAGLRRWVKYCLIGETDGSLPAPIVEDVAKRHHISVVRVERHSSAPTRAVLQGNKIDIVLLAASAWLIKEPLLSMPTTRIINVHPGRLPRHRSLDSLPWSILEHDVIGHSAHFVDAGIDTGPFLVFREVPIFQNDTLLSIRARIDGLRHVLFHTAVTGLADGSIFPQPQAAKDGIHHRPMTAAELLTAEDVLQDRLKSSSVPKQIPESEMLNLYLRNKAVRSI